MITGRARGVHRKFNISRIMLREMAAEGLIPGVYKASW
jgi:small subunit ribosomal protein S14